MNWEQSVEIDFYDRVWRVVRAVPSGRVTTYGAIAKYLGMRRGARLVGYAMNASHTAIPPVPAHRVVNHAGLLTGKFHFSTPTTMQQLLEAEGVIIINDKVRDFAKLFWDPLQNLPLPDIFFMQTCHPEDML
ncbi:MAG: MGMT family protein [Bacteroidia bacterium]|nr:MGMT family protein [Bacteroidia bacterium]MCX7651375.1 MGMT family protein [Bacteroidia bacterium]MDW8416725.1 MGMT family protein [Bacteroidia bacterium]